MIVAEEMGSGTQVDQDDFKAVVEQFAGQIKTVEEEIANQVKTQQAKAVELFESARLESSMVFGIDDEPIPGVDAPSSSNNAARSCRSIALNPLARVAANKRKREASSLEEPSNDTMLLADSIRDSTTMLASRLRNLHQLQLNLHRPPLLNHLFKMSFQKVKRFGK